MSVRRLRVLLAAGALLAAAPAGADPLAYETPAPVPLLASTYGLEWSQVVVVDGDALRPRRVEIREGEKLAWRSDAEGTLRIVFDAGVARSMRCTELVGFALEADRLRSEILHRGDVASLCELAPGRYGYRVEPAGPAAGPARSSSGPLEGEIVVRPRTEAAPGPRLAAPAAPR